MWRNLCWHKLTVLLLAIFTIAVYAIGCVVINGNLMGFGIFLALATLVVWLETQTEANHGGHEAYKRWLRGRTK